MTGRRLITERKETPVDGKNLTEMGFRMYRFYPSLPQDVYLSNEIVLTIDFDGYILIKFMKSDKYYAFGKNDFLSKEFLFYLLKKHGYRKVTRYIPEEKKMSWIQRMFKKTIETLF